MDSREKRRGDSRDRRDREPARRAITTERNRREEGYGEIRKTSERSGHETEHRKSREKNDDHGDDQRRRSRGDDQRRDPGRRLGHFSESTTTPSIDRDHHRRSDRDRDVDRDWSRDLKTNDNVRESEKVDDKKRDSGMGRGKEIAADREKDSSINKYREESRFNGRDRDKDRDKDKNWERDVGRAKDIGRCGNEDKFKADRVCDQYPYGSGRADRNRSSERNASKDGQMTINVKEPLKKGKDRSQSRERSPAGMAEGDSGRKRPRDIGRENKERDRDAESVFSSFLPSDKRRKASRDLDDGRSIDRKRPNKTQREDSSVQSKETRNTRDRTDGGNDRERRREKSTDMDRDRDRNRERSNKSQRENERERIQQSDEGREKGKERIREQARYRESGKGERGRDTESRSQVTSEHNHNDNALHSASRRETSIHYNDKNGGSDNNKDIFSNNVNRETDRWAADRRKRGRSELSSRHTKESPEPRSNDSSDNKNSNGSSGSNIRSDLGSSTAGGNSNSSSNVDEFGRHSREIRAVSASNGNPVRHVRGISISRERCASASPHEASDSSSLEERQRAVKSENSECSEKSQLDRLAVGRRRSHSRDRSANRTAAPMGSATPIDTTVGAARSAAGSPSIKRSSSAARYGKGDRWQDSRERGDRKDDSRSRTNGDSGSRHHGDGAGGVSSRSSRSKEKAEVSSRSDGRAVSATEKGGRAVGRSASRERGHWSGGARQFGDNYSTAGRNNVYGPPGGGAAATSSGQPLGQQGQQGMGSNARGRIGSGYPLPPAAPPGPPGGPRAPQQQQGAALGRNAGVLGRGRGEGAVGVVSGLSIYGPGNSGSFDMHRQTQGGRFGQAFPERGLPGAMGGRLLAGSQQPGAAASGVGGVQPGFGAAGGNNRRPPLPPMPPPKPKPIPPISQNRERLAEISGSAEAKTEMNSAEEDTDLDDFSEDNDDYFCPFDASIDGARPAEAVRRSVSLAETWALELKDVLISKRLAGYDLYYNIKELRYPASALPAVGPSPSLSPSSSVSPLPVPSLSTDISQGGASIRDKEVGEDAGSASDDSKAGEAGERAAAGEAKDVAGVMNENRTDRVKAHGGAGILVSETGESTRQEEEQEKENKTEKEGVLRMLEKEEEEDDEDFMPAFSPVDQEEPVDTETSENQTKTKDSGEKNDDESASMPGYSPILEEDASMDVEMSMNPETAAKAETVAGAEIDSKDERVGIESLAEESNRETEGLGKELTCENERETGATAKGAEGTSEVQIEERGDKEEQEDLGDEDEDIDLYGDLDLELAVDGGQGGEDAGEVEGQSEGGDDMYADLDSAADIAVVETPEQPQRLAGMAVDPESDRDSSQQMPVSSDLPYDAAVKQNTLAGSVENPSPSTSSAAAVVGGSVSDGVTTTADGVTRAAVGAGVGVSALSSSIDVLLESVADSVAPQSVAPSTLASSETGINPVPSTDALATHVAVVVDGLAETHSSADQQQGDVEQRAEEEEAAAAGERISNGIKGIREVEFYERTAPQPLTETPYFLQSFSYERSALFARAMQEKGFAAHFSQLLPDIVQLFEKPPAPTA